MEIKVPDFSVSVAAEELFFFDPLRKNRTGFPLMHMCLRLTGAWSVEVLTSAISTVVDRHEILRTGYIQSEGLARRVVQSCRCFKLTLLNISSVKGSSIEQEIAICAAAHLEVLDLSKPPLFRAAIVKRSQEEAFLLLTMHHIIYDGASWSLLRGEIFDWYKKISEQQAESMPLPIQYASYAAQQRQQLLDDPGRRLLEYWRRKCENLPEPLEFEVAEADNGPAPRQTAVLEVSANVIGRFAAVAERAGASLFMAVQAVIVLVLSAKVRSNDIVIGTPFMSRGLIADQAILGCFVDQLILRYKIDLDRSFTEFLRDVRNETLSAYDHHSLPSDLVAASVGLEFEEFHRCAYSVMLVDQSKLPGTSSLHSDLQAAGLEMELYATPSLTAAFQAGLPQAGAGQPVLSWIISQLDRHRPMTGFLTYFRGRSERSIFLLNAMVDDFARLIALAGDSPELSLRKIIETLSIDEVRDATAP